MAKRGFTLKFDTWIRALIIIIIHFLTTPEFYNPLALNFTRSSLKVSREEEEGPGQKKRKVSELTEAASQTDVDVTPTSDEETQTTDDSGEVVYSEHGSQTTDHQGLFVTSSQGSQTSEPDKSITTVSVESLSHGTDQSDKLDESGEPRLPPGVGVVTPDGATCLESDLETTSFGEEASSSSHDVYMVDAREAATLTEICNREDLPEVNLLSLLEEQIPRYVLRADTLTDFAGYDNSDRIQFPCLPPEVALDLSPPLIAETLKYFTLCGDRVSQMTRTYNDIEAVTRLLEEKERDLELAARIGQTLLDKNKDLESKNEDLDENFTQATEKIRQLKYEISLKDDLLRIYVKDYDCEEDDPTGTGEHGLNLNLVNLDSLQRKVKNLEEENITLQDETSDLRKCAVELETREEQLVTDCVRQLGETQAKLKLLTDDLATKSDVNLKQQEDITDLKTKIINHETKIKKLTLENADVSTHLTAAQTSQKQLTTELSEMTEKHQECLALIREQGEELKALRRKHGPRALRHHFSSYTPLHPSDSLASELETSMMRDKGYPEGYSPEERRSHTKKVMETAKFVRSAGSSQAVSRASSMLKLPGSTPWSSSSGNESCESICGSSNRSSLYLSEDVDGSDGYHGDTDSVYGSLSSSQIGRPGLPGSNDLETALRRLSARQNRASEHSLKEEDELDQHRFLHEASPSSCRTPESMMSTGSCSELSRISQFRLPEKLQIVKPMEGSIMLHQWQRLATPNLGGIFEEHPGIAHKGERQVDMDTEIYTLSDIEEDDDPSLHMGKCAELTSSTFTYTTAKILHPTDDYNTTTTASSSNARMSSHPYAHGSGTKATSTFSLSQGLASILHERGITAGINGNINPSRFPSIVSETISSTVTSTSDAVYTKAEFKSTLDNISLTARPLLHPEFTALFEQIKDIGLQKLSKQEDVNSSSYKDSVIVSDLETDTETIVDSESDTDNSLALKAQSVTNQVQVKPGVSLLTQSETSAAVSNILNVWKSSRRKLELNKPHFTPPIRDLPSYFAPIRDLPLYLRNTSSNDTVSPQKSTEPSPTRDAFSPMADETPPFTLASTIYSKIHNVPIASPSVTKSTNQRQPTLGLLGALVSPSGVSSKQPVAAASTLSGISSPKVTSKPVSNKTKGLFESEGVNIMRQEFYNDPNMK